MKRRGFLLVTVLLLLLILLILGLTFIGRKAIQYRRASLAEQSLAARCLAEAGMEEALLKLQRDLLFPPLTKDQKRYSYTEEVSVAGERVGSYTVTVDGSYRNQPYGILVLHSLGSLGPPGEPPVAVRAIRVEFDVSPELRDGSGDPNPYYYTVINWQDLGGP